LKTRFHHCWFAEFSNNEAVHIPLLLIAEFSNNTTPQGSFFEGPISKALDQDSQNKNWLNNFSETTSEELPGSYFSPKMDMHDTRF